MKILKSVPFVLLYASIAIVATGAVLYGARLSLAPFDPEVLAICLIFAGSLMSLIFGSMAAYYIYIKIEDRTIDEEDSDE